MGELRDRMEGDLLLKGVAAVTRAEYLRCATQLAAHYRRSPAALGVDDVRSYLVHLVDTLHYSPANLKMHVAALKFLYTVTLNRPDVVERIPYPKIPRVLLDIPSPGEVASGPRSASASSSTPGPVNSLSIPTSTASSRVEDSTPPPIAG